MFINNKEIEILKEISIRPEYEKDRNPNTIGKLKECGMIVEIEKKFFLTKRAMFLLGK